MDLKRICAEIDRVYQLLRATPYLSGEYLALHNELMSLGDDLRKAESKM
jgi:hypothetical protein